MTPLVLPDGTRLWTRPIRPDDKFRLEQGLRRLSAETIRRRFLAAKPRFSKAELRYLTEVDGHNHIALVAVDADGDIVAVARCVRLAERADTAEMAIVVGDALQGRGLGRELARRLADAAKQEGISRFAATMLADNEAVRRIMLTIATRLEDHRAAAGLREMVGDLAA